MTGAPLLSVRDLTVSYALGGRVGRAADGISFDIEPGQRLGIVGESGSGKSTLALALMRLHRPPARIERGTAMLDGTDIMKLEGEALRRFRWRQIALIPQGAMNSLNPVMTVGTQMADAIGAHEGRSSRREVTERIEAALESVGLPASARQLFPHELSGGMKQRVCIALAIILKPKLIIADEPTSALDVVVQRKVIETLKRVQSEIGAGLIMIGHDMGLMAQSVDRLAVMYAGRMVDIAPIRDFFRRPLHPYSRALIASLPDMDQRREVVGIPGAQPPLFDLPAGCAFHPRCSFQFDRCLQEVPPLTEAGQDRAAACHAVAEKELA
jgi:oligopeptide/dipeptide ABC transporter ATP-binding protein